jgi:copper transport protein
MRIQIPLFLLILLLIVVIPVAAHGFIERSDPEDDAVLSESPETVKIWFSEALVPGSGAISIVDGAGNTIEPLRVYHDPSDDTILIAELPPDLPESAYIVTASAVVVSDGHEPSGSIVFWVGERSAAGARNDSQSPAYGMVALFFGVMIACAGAGIALYRRDSAAIDVTPDHAATHYPLE